MKKALVVCVVALVVALTGCGEVTTNTNYSEVNKIEVEEIKVHGIEVKTITTYEDVTDTWD